jgi:S-adenosylhomocysteine hydrolase
VTGDINVVDRKHFEVMKDGAIVANSGHFNVEINIPALEKMSQGKPSLVRPFVDQYITKDGRKINILGEGRLIKRRIEPLPFLDIQELKVLNTISLYRPIYLRD